MPKGYPKDMYPEQYKEEPVGETGGKLSIEEVLLQLKEAEQEKDSAKALAQVGDALDALTETDREKLLATPAVTRLLETSRLKAQKDGAPGSVVCDAKGRVLERVEWTYDALAETFGQILWTPLQTRWLTFNGVQVWVQEGVEITTPPQFKAIATEAWERERDMVKIGKGILRKNFGDQSMMMSGDGTPI